MSYSTKAKLAEIDRNLDQFLRQLPSLLAEHAGKYALLRDQHIVAYYESAIDAQIAGNRQFGDRPFSIQQVKEVAEELGHFAYAIPSREA
jgi:hypothetical protein